LGSSSPAANLELKARDADPAATALACERLGAVDRGILRQRDTYFAVAAGRLKLREEPTSGSAELIYYERPALAGVRESRYWRLEVDDPGRLRAMLELALGVIGVVEKERRLFLFQHVRIHLDEVAGLGSFVELEAVESGRPGDDPVLDEVMRALRLDQAELVAGGYLELLELA
jgi:predicted adenylyl cyclase CyaB